MNLDDLRATLDTVDANGRSAAVPVFVQCDRRKHPIRAVEVRARGSRARRPRDIQVVVADERTRS